MSRAIQEIEDDIEETATPELGQLPFRFYSSPQNKTTKLVANSGKSSPVEGRNRSFDFDFKEPVFLAYVVIRTNGYRPSDRFEFYVTKEDSKKEYGYQRPEKDLIKIELNEYVSGFSFTPPTSWLRSTHINSLEVYGFHQNDVSEFVEFISQIDELKDEALAEIERSAADANEILAELSAREAQRDSLNSEIADAENRISSLQNDVSTKNSELAEIHAKIGSEKSQLDNLAEQQERIRAEVTRLTEERNELKTDSNRLQKRLTELRDEIDIFPSEIAGFIKQAGNDLKLYNNYTVGLVAIISAVLIWVISGSFDLSEFIKDNADRDVWSLIAAKIPLSIVVAALITAAYKLARVFVQEQMAINRQKLSLTQVSIIAKDISQASEHDLELSREEIYSARLKVKMALLADHIKTFIKSDPEDVLPRRLFGLSRSDMSENDSVEEAKDNSQE